MVERRLGGNVSKSIEASCQVSKAIIENDGKKYHAYLNHQDTTVKEGTERMSALFTLIGKTNSDALDTIQDLNKGIVELHHQLLKISEKVVQEYQQTLLLRRPPPVNQNPLTCYERATGGLTRGACFQQAQRHYAKE